MCGWECLLACLCEWWQNIYFPLKFEVTNFIVKQTKLFLNLFAHAAAIKSNLFYFPLKTSFFTNYALDHEYLRVKHTVYFPSGFYDDDDATTHRDLSSKNNLVKWLETAFSLSAFSNSCRRLLVFNDTQFSLSKNKNSSKSDPHAVCYFVVVVVAAVAYVDVVVVAVIVVVVVF